MITREAIIQHILAMKQKDETYARYALQQYHSMLPDFDLMNGVREALKGNS